ncbi:MAG: hypothetical protein Q9162_007929, partial [Coniocarpon cinnabarinum]
SVVLQGLRIIVTEETAAMTTGLDLYMSVFRDGPGRKPHRPIIVYGTAINEIGLLEYTWTVEPGDGIVETKEKFPNPGLEDINRKMVLGGKFSPHELFPAMPEDLSLGGEFQIAAISSTQRGILRLDIFSRPDGRPFVDVRGDRVRGFKISFEGEKDPAAVKSLLYQDRDVIKNSCEREWVALKLGLGA